MAFPTSIEPLAADLTRVIQAAKALKETAVANRTRMAAGAVTASSVLRLLDNLRAARAIFIEIASRPGIGAYAQAQLGEDISTEFAAMNAAIDAAGANIVASLPKDGSGYLLLEQMDGQGARAERTFTTAQTATLRGLLDTLAATID